MAEAGSIDVQVRFRGLLLLELLTKLRLTPLLPWALRRVRSEARVGRRGRWVDLGLRVKLDD